MQQVGCRDSLSVLDEERKECLSSVPKVSSQLREINSQIKNLTTSELGRLNENYKSVEKSFWRIWSERYKILTRVATLK